MLQTWLVLWWEGVKYLPWATHYWDGKICSWYAIVLLYFTINGWPLSSPGQLIHCFLTVSSTALPHPTVQYWSQSFAHMHIVLAASSYIPQIHQAAIPQESCSYLAAWWGRAGSPMVSTSPPPQMACPPPAHIFCLNDAVSKTPHHPTIIETPQITKKSIHFPLQTSLGLSPSLSS